MDGSTRQIWVNDIFSSYLPFSKTKLQFTFRIRLMLDCKIPTGNFNYMYISLYNSVCLRYEQKLYYVDVKPTLKRASLLDSTKICHKWYDSTKGDIWALDIQGKGMRRTEVNKDGSSVLRAPTCLAVHPKRNMVYVFDVGGQNCRHAFFRMGKSLISWKMQSFTCVDGNGNVLACGQYNKVIQIWPGRDPR